MSELIAQMKAPQLAIHVMDGLVVLSVFGEDAPLTCKETVWLIARLHEAVAKAAANSG